jgi:SAM-dependent methyltransferase
MSTPPPPATEAPATETPQTETPQTETPQTEAHQHRQVAESFGTDAERYDRARPRYPEALISRVIAESPGREILDIGCGTGIVARQFQAAGGRVLGVDPDARMADLARQSGVEVEVARIEDWDPAGRLFDAAVSGQAWHWVDPVAGAARAARALRAQGRLALFWNAFQPPPELAEAFSGAIRRALPDSPFRMPPGARSAADVYLAGFPKVENGLAEAGGFGEPDRWRFAWEWTYTRDAWLDQMPTTGVLTTAPPEAVAQVLAEAGAAIDAAGGSFVAQYTTVVLTALRSSDG